MLQQLNAVPAAPRTIRPDIPSELDRLVLELLAKDPVPPMLRTDYIPLGDTNKLNLLADYYVDYMDMVIQILGPVDQLIVGRRGTGKTTLLYRGLVECMRSWGKAASAGRR
jgi:hypothetical protein